jgi:P2 family phage contractile tail tube protein
MAIDTITNANVYLAGSAKLVGKIGKIELPKLKIIKEEVDPIGTRSKSKVPTGFEHPQAKTMWTSFYPDAYRSRLSVKNAVDLQIESVVQTWTNGVRSGDQPVAMLFSLSPEEIGLGTLEGNKMIADLEDTYDVPFMTVDVAGTRHIEIDIDNDIFNIDGVSQF